jgi:hypothetical protein
MAGPLTCPLFHPLGADLGVVCVAASPEYVLQASDDYGVGTTTVPVPLSCMLLERPTMTVPVAPASITTSAAEDWKPARSLATNALLASTPPV